MSNDCLLASLLPFGKHRGELLTRMVVAIEARERSPGHGARKRGSEENAALPLPEHPRSNYLLLSALLFSWWPAAAPVAAPALA
jgi:hypothetical protein